MVKVNNRRVVTRLARKSLLANRTRNIIAVAAIALTAMLFTALFTIALTILNTFEQQTFRQVGSNFSGAFKNVTEAQMDELAADPMIAESGRRLMLGMPSKAPFNKIHAEVSYMDEVYAKSAFCTPTAGRLPAEGSNEIACDTRILELLGVDPAVGAAVTLDYDLGVGSYTTTPVTGTFVLSGWWEYDPAAVSSMAIVSRSYAEAVLAGYDGGDPNDKTGTWTLNVMLRDNLSIESDLKTILANHGYQADDAAAENYIAIGVNWGYLSSAAAEIDPGTMAALGLLLAVIMLTGYLIIYNVFQISVSGDIRFYGLLKTIGTTPRQLRRLVRVQALVLACFGIPAGLLAGYGLGYGLAPLTLAILSFKNLYVSPDPRIFLFAAAFALVTVLISCARPGRAAGRVSPVEAARYTEGAALPRRATRKAKNGGRPAGMALANLRRSPKKTALVVVSLSLAVGLMQAAYTLASGFDMDKFLGNFVVSDFVLGDAAYFSMNHTDGSLTQADIDAVLDTGLVSASTTVTTNSSVCCFMPESMYRSFMGGFVDAETLEATLAQLDRDAEGNVLYNADLYGMDHAALERLTLLEGDLSALNDPDAHNIAAVYTSDEEDRDNPSNYAHVGDTITLRVVEEWELYNALTGESATEADADANPQNYNTRPLRWHDESYNVVACVTVPTPMSLRAYGGPQFVLNRDALAGWDGTRLLNCLLTVDEANTDAMESFLRDYTESAAPNLSYESKARYTEQFEQLRSMFLLLGGALSAVVAVVGVLNFLNATLTSILARRREFAVLQAVGMTGRQLNAMLVCEGLLYAALAGAVSLALCLGVGAAMQAVVGEILWFFTYRFTLLPVAVMLPCFVLLGAALPPLAYRFIARQSIVDRLRQSE